MKIKYEMIKREIAGEIYLVPIGEAARSYSGLFALSEVAAYIWDKLPDCADIEAVVDAVLEEYEIDRDTANADVKEFLGKLKEMGILE